MPLKIFDIAPVKTWKGAVKPVVSCQFFQLSSPAQAAAPTTGFVVVYSDMVKIYLPNPARADEFLDSTLNLPMALSRTFCDCAIINTRKQLLVAVLDTHNREI